MKRVGFQYLERYLRYGKHYSNGTFLGYGLNITALVPSWDFWKHYCTGGYMEYGKHYSIHFCYNMFMKRFTLYIVTTKQREDGREINSIYFTVILIAWWREQVYFETSFLLSNQQWLHSEELQWTECKMPLQQNTGRTWLNMQRLITWVCQVCYHYMLKPCTQKQINQRYYLS